VKRLALALLALAAIALIAHLWARPDNGAPGRYRTQPAEVGEVVQAVTANGTLNPVTLVQVGTQVSGTVYRVHVDFNDPVRAGQVLAELDPALLEAALKQSEANLQNAQASLELARSNLRRTMGLFERKLTSDAERDAAEERLQVAEAEVRIAEAQVERDRTNRRYTVIRSPIDGVVLNRSVNVGQTVAASFQTPTLFVIAQDLRQVQIDTSVAEADVGRLVPAHPVTFTVDAYPGREYQGRIRQVRLNPSVQQNVVTYNVVVDAENEDGSLLPGMTAHVAITLARREGVLRVPTAALSFRPKAVGEEGAERRPPGPRIYVLERERLRPVEVQTGLTDTSYTEVTGGDLRPGDLVVLRELTPRPDAQGSGFRFRMM